MARGIFGAIGNLNVALVEGRVSDLDRRMSQSRKGLPLLFVTVCVESHKRVEGKDHPVTETDHIDCLIAGDQADRLAELKCGDGLGVEGRISTRGAGTERSTLVMARRSWLMPDISGRRRNKGQEDASE